MYFTNKRTPHVKNMFISMLNTIIDYDTQGNGVPYISSSFKYDSDVLLIENCLACLNVLIEFRPPTKENVAFLIEGGFAPLKLLRDHLKKPDETTDEVNADISANEFYRLLQVIHGKVNLEPLSQGFAKIIHNYVEANNTYLPDSVIAVPFFEESLILFWRFLHGNSKLMEEIVSNPAMMEKIAISIMFCFDHNKKDPQKSNMLYICVFILLTLSSSREFSLHLNEPYNMKLPFDIPDFQHSTLANLLVQVIFRSIQVGPRVLAPLYKSLVSIVSNVAPYAKNLTKESAENILSLVV